MKNIKLLIKKYKTTNRLLLFAIDELKIEKMHVYDLGLEMISGDETLREQFLASNDRDKKEKGIIAAGITSYLKDMETYLLSNR